MNAETVANVVCRIIAMKLFSLHVCQIVAALFCNLSMSAESTKDLATDSDVEKMVRATLGRQPTKTGTLQSMAVDNSLVHGKTFTGTMQELLNFLTIPAAVSIEEVGVNGFYVARFRISPSYELVAQGMSSDHKYNKFTFSKFFLAPYREELYRLRFSDPRRWSEIMYP